MAKKNTINADSRITAKIPYKGVYKEMDMIETEPGRFTRMYALSDIDPGNVTEAELSLVGQKIVNAIENICGTGNIKIQFLSHNKLIDEGTFFERVLVRPAKGNAIDHYTNLYNKTVVENAAIGNNNVRQTKYMILSAVEDTAEEAVERFKVLDKVVEEVFDNIYGISAEAIDITERLKIMYDILNCGRDNFGKRAGISDTVDLETLRRMKVTTKDIIAPTSIDDSNADHLILNGNIYAKTFFLNTMPAKVAGSMISDILNITGRMVYSITMEPYDTELGKDIVQELVLKNTIVKTTPNRKTLQDKKNKSVIKEETAIKNNEPEYFNKQALDTLQMSTASNQSVYGCTVLITLFADSLDDLDNCANLLRISASKFACQIKSLDAQQLKGLQSVLPLCNTKVDVKRVLPCEKASVLVPINLYSVLKKNGLYYGINIFNDNLVLLNRKNYPVTSGMIAGIKGSGKTYQMKREIFNNLISTDDRIIIINNNKDRDYDDFITSLGGSILNGIRSDVFEQVQGYAIIDDANEYKTTFLQGLTEIEANYTSEYKWAHIKDNSFIAEKEKQLHDDISGYLQGRVTVTDSNFAKIINRRSFGASNGIECNLTLINTDSTAFGLMQTLDFVWNRAIELKKRNINTWIYVDGMDDAFEYPHTCDYIRSYIRYCNLMDTVFTFSVQDSAKIIVSNNFVYEDIIKNLGYVKLLNQGPKERQKYAELLNIPNVLLNYISTADGGHIGSGLIITNTNNIAFDDSFADTTGDAAEFHDLFKKDIAQRI